ncbi:F-BAR domain only protein 2-like [Hydractinia symbiolongicarpus]|uniref:F-BAR domain only protein 2-like n=1 Tax=Hydractinia symbiolongicarpus TaxID=13093 RepID=UPI00254BD7C5|nr:F-BAR domain only protein 2-like [Hydractinia symbiolongicarpus]
MVNFEEHFWGEKYNGFDVLQQNFKLGLNASKEFSEFLKERSGIEETYSKSLVKLVNRCSSANSHIGSFEPCWKFLQTSTEKLANVHNKVIQNLGEVSRAVRDYSEQQKEKQKQIKDEFTSTSEAVLHFQNQTSALVKAKELYHQRSLEVEKFRKDITGTSTKDIRNAEAKFKKSTEDYKQLVEKRETARKDFHEKMTEMAQKLQGVEEEHLKTMLDILSRYNESVKVELFLLQQTIDEFERNMVALTVESLLQQFINVKQTGKEKPQTIEFMEATITSKPVDIDALTQSLKEEKKKKKAEKKEKKAGRKKKKEKVSANGTAEKITDDSAENQTELQLDEDGYVIRPADTGSIHSGRSKDSFSSDSESDSDEEGRKIQVRIKPVEESKGSNSDLSEDQLKKLSATLTLMSPSTVQQKLSQHHDDRKHVSVWGSHSSLNKLSAKSRSNNDLLNLDKNSDTASLHSLPVNSSIPGMENSSPAGSTNHNFDASFASPLSSPDHLRASFTTSPSESFDKSAESLTIMEHKGLTDESAPPLPVKSRSISLNASASSADFNAEFEKNADHNRTHNELEGRLSSGSSTAVNFTNKLFSIGMPEKTSSLPPSAKLSTNLEPLKPPPSEKRPVIPPPSSTGSRGGLSNAASLPRPKPGQLPSPPVAPPRQPTHSSSSIRSDNSQSSLTDLLDINFSTIPNVPVLSPTVPEKESTTSHWVNPETSSSTDRLPTPSLSTDISIPPVISVPPDIRIPPSLPLKSATLPASGPPTTTTSTAGERAIPIAVAFIETVNGVFKGSDENSSVIKITGDMTISFPANIIAMLSNNTSPPVLSFLVTGTASLEQIFPNKALVERGGQLPGGEGMMFKFNMAALSAYLKKQAEQGAKASYYNIDILKYQVRCSGMASAPLQLSAYWRCDTEQTDLKIDYKYNCNCMSSPVPLNNVSVVVPVDGGVTIMQSKPTAIWSSEHQRCMWKLAAISSTVDNTGVNALRARFDITSGPTTPVPIAVQFTGEGSTISLLNFDLKSPAYKLSLVKKRFASGKYMVEAS